MKKLLSIVAVAALVAGCSSAPAQKTDAELEAEGWVKNPLENGYVLAEEAGNAAELPAPIDTTKTYKPDKDAEETACAEGVYDTACSSIGVENLTEYLGREDVLYIDLRDFGDFAGKHLRNFEVIPYFGYLVDAQATSPAETDKLFYGADAQPTYEESEAILKALFPQDKTIFLMCQSGGRVKMLMNILAAKGWDMSKIYNVGGMGQYTGGEYRDLTVDTPELTLEATYTFADLTKKA